MLRELIDLVGPHSEEETVINGGEMRKLRRDALLRYLIWAVVILLLVLLLGKWLWNGVLVPHVTIFRPVESIWTILGLVVLFMILKPN